ncbi:hypothetical protein P153DRAFT_381418 [Dothidotthia symphoricarpi CBS 119687]|uniref:Uncharacterized protein n=1 Tax=Dothidotthia symphoricarpi CBS 119687 TaxID=1392245 RepID=A0A6A6ARR4_9PLEO|nr:uncharacterized protein P153DRAFT_381418 [Dothidotthia symphoricarpi CBS 119687]KAF2134236.1 hypothetical protein P153DRAFT_381418 [Dothidotthia symphoricarpi CBS 119687]
MRAPIPLPTAGKRHAPTAAAAAIATAVPAHVHHLRSFRVQAGPSILLLHRTGVYPRAVPAPSPPATARGLLGSIADRHASCRQLRSFGPREAFDSRPKDPEGLTILPSSQYSRPQSRLPRDPSSAAFVRLQPTTRLLPQLVSRRRSKRGCTKTSLDRPSANNFPRNSGAAIDLEW